MTYTTGLKSEELHDGKEHFVKFDNLQKKESIEITIPAPPKGFRTLLKCDFYANVFVNPIIGTTGAESMPAQQNKQMELESTGKTDTIFLRIVRLFRTYPLSDQDNDVLNGTIQFITVKKKV